MNHTLFKPGFRISKLDFVILLIGAAGGVILEELVAWGGIVCGFVILNFFLFCNVFRISRNPELIWAGIFVALSVSTIYFDFPGWILTLLSCAVLSAVLIWRETKRDSYHGVFWQIWNPQLQEWWMSRSNGISGETAPVDGD